jgi:hypothetical protein
MERTLANATAYLEPRDLSIARIGSCIEEVRPWEALIFGGSIPEGLANADSDIDLMLLGATRPRDGQVVLEGDAEVAWERACAPLKIQLESVKFSHLESLATRMEETAQALEDPARVPRLHSFPLADLRIMHRVRTGIPVRNPEVAASWRERLHVELLPTYLLVLMIVQHFSLREDAIGEAREGRRESSLWLMRESVSRAAGALLASVGESHSYDKWRVRLLQLHEPRLGAKPVRTLINYLIGTTICDDVQAYLRDAIDLSDEVLESAMINRPEVLPILMKLREEQPTAMTTHVLPG